MVETIQFVGLAISSGVLILTIIVHKIEGGKKKPPEPDNPLALTTQAMEAELAELLENNRHMEHIQRLEKQIKEAKAHAEALSKVASNYGNTTKEVGESIAGGIGGRNAVRKVTPNRNKLDGGNTRQNTAIYRTYTRQAGWSSYYDVKLK